MAISSCEQERADLSLADQHIADGEKRIAEQEARIDRLRADGHDVKVFEKMLVTFKELAVAQQNHRKTILERIRDLEAEGRD